MKNFKSKIQLLACLSMLLATVITSCSHEKHGEIVKDTQGNYYELDGNSALGEERYLLNEVDTNKYKPVGF